MAAVQQSERERNESEVNVLVMCQRKTGKCSSDSSNNVEDDGMTIDKIKHFFNDYFKDKHVNIEFLSDLSISGDLEHDTADYQFPLVRTNNEAKKFIRSHLDYYHAVLLTTCPLQNIDFLAIHHILNKNGHLIIKNFECIVDGAPITEKYIPFTAPNNFYNGRTIQIIHNFFATTESINVFVKKSLDFGGTRKRKKRYNRKKSKSIKN